MNKRKTIKSSEAKGALKRVIALIWATNKWYFMLIIFGFVISSVVNVLGQSYLGLVLFNKFLVPFFQSGFTEFDWNGFNLSIIILVSLFLSGVLFEFIATRLAVFLTHTTIKNLRDSLYAKMQTLPISYFDKKLKGDLMSLFVNDVDVLKQFIMQTVPTIFSSLATLIVTTVFMLYYSWFLSLIVFALVGTTMFLSSVYARKSSKFFTLRQKRLGIINGFINEMINGVKVIKVFNHQEASFEDMQKRNKEFYEADYKSKAYVTVLFPVFMNIGNINYAIIAIISGFIYLNGGKVGSLDVAISAGVIVAFLQYARNFSLPISQIVQEFNTLAMAAAGARRVFNAMDNLSEVDKGSIEIINHSDLPKSNIIWFNSYDKEKFLSEPSRYYFKIPMGSMGCLIKRINGKFDFNHVYAGYVEGQPIIKDFDLHIKPGERVAFVGATGAGKTTITNLINRFYDVFGGSIKLDGIDIRLIKKSSLRKSLGYVLQEISLFTKSIADNIAYGVPDATLKDIKEAAKIANATRFIKQTEDGFNTILENAGESLSQGQKQLLSIARTSMLDPMILVLDEATSTIDTETEREIQEAMYELMKNKTSFVIAHRLSTIRDVDKIVVMDQGQIKEVGSHDELIKLHGIYHQLYTGKIELD
ncbi:ABC transporter ATP-binding protein [Mycoplasma sp. 4463]|uniref:ABC transporter ATP-binding protein n=1 Tax=Mycoplasma sp. 4463 TaxID=3400998 RepID=UPI003AAF6B26